MRKILLEIPGKTIYTSGKSGEIYHAFTDTHHCAQSDTVIEIPGKGAINNRVSSFLFKKLNALQIPTHFISMRNMRESMVQEVQSLPFEITVRCRSDSKMAQHFDISEDQSFSPLLVEYHSPQSVYQLNEHFLMSVGWIDQDELEEIMNLALRTTHLLQGIFILFQAHLVSVRFAIGYSAQNRWCIAGQLSPDFFCIKDVSDKPEYWGKEYIASHAAAHLHYHHIARQFGIFSSMPYRQSC